MNMNTNEILESIYKAYGSDSGILFGITDKQVTKAIIEFTINRLPESPSPSDRERELEKEVERLKGYLLTAYPILALRYRNKGQFLQNEYLDAIEIKN